MTNVKPEEARFAGSGLNRLNIVVLILGFCAIAMDGFDIYAMSVAAPHLLQEWGIANRAILGPLFSVSIVGMFVGAPACGYLADKIGRRRVAILSCALIGLPTLAIVMASSLRDLIVLRFIAGIGFGGIGPCFISLMTEYAPARYRATMVTTMYVGITIGAAAAGAAGTWLVPVYGWRSLFAIGGVGALAVGALSVLLLPESLSYLRARGKVPATLQNPVEPSLISQVEHATGPKMPFFKAAFQGKLAVISPMTWIVNFTILVGYQAIASWLPSLLSTVERPAASAASFLMLFQVGGMLGGIFLSRFIDRGHIVAIAWAFLASVPLVALIPVTGHSDLLLSVTVFCAGFSVMSVQFSINAVCSMAYPTSIRSSALGVMFAIGRIGSVCGPLLISLGLVLGMAPIQTFALACVPFVVGAIASFVLARAWKDRQSGVDVTASDTEGKRWA